MSVVFIVLPLALVVVFAAIAAYTWAARRGQFDDLATPPLRILHEDGEAGAPAGPPGEGAPPDAAGAPRVPPGAAETEEDPEAPAERSGTPDRPD